MRLIDLFEATSDQEDPHVLQWQERDENFRLTGIPGPFNPRGSAVMSPGGRFLQKVEKELGMTPLNPQEYYKHKKKTIYGTKIPQDESPNMFAAVFTGGQVDR